MWGSSSHCVQPLVPACHKPLVSRLLGQGWSPTTLPGCWALSLGHIGKQLSLPAEPTETHLLGASCVQLQPPELYCRGAAIIAGMEPMRPAEIPCHIAGACSPLFCSISACPQQRTSLAAAVPRMQSRPCFHACMLLQGLSRCTRSWTSPSTSTSSAQASPSCMQTPAQTYVRWRPSSWTTWTLMLCDQAFRCVSPLLDEAAHAWPPMCQLPNLRGGAYVQVTCCCSTTHLPCMRRQLPRQPLGSLTDYV